MLKRKLWRDIKEHKAQFLCIFFMTFLGIGVYTGINSGWYGMQESVDTYYEETNFADTWIYQANFDDEHIAKLEELDYVERVQRRLQFDVDITDEKSLQVNYIEDNDISKVKVLKGDAFSFDEDGIYIEEAYANANKLKIGDTITYELPFKDADGSTITSTKEIKAFIVNPEYVQYSKDGASLFMDNEHYGYAYLPISSLDVAYDVPYSSLALITTKPMKDSEVKEIKKSLDSENAIVVDRENNRSYKSYDDEIFQIKEMSYLFPVIFLAIAVLSTMTAMIRIVGKQRGQIGILKAIGFKNRKIVLHYITYSFWITLAGAILGYVIGPLLIGGIILGAMDKMFTVPNLVPLLAMSNVYMVIGSVVVIILVTYIACRSELHEIIAESLRIKSPKLKKANILERSALWKKLSFYIQWNLRDVLRNKIRTLMGIFGVAGSCMLLVCALGLNDTVKSIPEKTYDNKIVYETKVNLDTQDIAKIEMLKDDYNGQYLMQTYIEVKTKDTSKNTLLNVIENNDMMKYYDQDKKQIKLKDHEVIMSNKLMETFALDIGDSFTWRITGENEWKTSTIADSQKVIVGQGVVMKKETLNEYDYDFFPTSILSDTKKTDIEENEAISSIQSVREAKDDLSNSLKVMDMIILVMVIGSIFLCVVVMYNLGELTMNEKIRELASLKVLGFKNIAVSKIFRMQNLWLTFIGMIVGTPFGYFLLGSIMSTMQEDFDLTSYVSINSHIVIYIGLLIVTLLVNIIFSRKIKNIDMVESLKGVE